VAVITRKYGRNSNEAAKPTAYLLTTVMRDSELYVKFRIHNRNKSNL